MTQTRSGKAFEYALAEAFAKYFGLEVTGPNLPTLRGYFTSSADIQRMEEAALKVVDYLVRNDTNITNTTSVRVQADAAGRKGDVRDVILGTLDGDVGLSAKRNNEALKHSRLSNRIDFGALWGGHPVSEEYWGRIRPIFDTLALYREDDVNFKDIEDKEEHIYVPVLSAFLDEFTRLSSEHGEHFIRNVFEYLVGSFDFYKVMLLRKRVVVQPFNLRGTLGWGRRWRTPKRILDASWEPNSSNKVKITFDQSWALTFRLHNARTKAEPSLKFDVNLVGVASYATGRDIELQS